MRYSEMQKKVITKINDLEEIAVKKGFKTPATEKVKFVVKFDIKSGQFAGQAWYNHTRKEYGVRFHNAALEEYKDDYIESTVIHEFAHILNYLNRPLAKPHGREFKMFMTLLGGKPNRCHNYDLRSITPGIKKQKLHVWYCDCQSHEVSTTIHNRLNKGQKYCCNKCKVVLRKKK